MSMKFPNFLRLSEMKLNELANKLKRNAINVSIKQFI